MDLKGKKINFLGDSITEGHGTSAVDKRFTNIIEKNSGAICRNYGISGTRVATQKNKCEDIDNLDFNIRYNKMDNDADFVVVFGGTNDFGHGDAPFGTFNDRTPDTFCGALHSLFSGLIEKYPAAKFAILTPLHRDGEMFKDGPHHNKPTDVGNLKDYLNAIKETAEYYSLPVLDLFATSGMQPSIQIIREKYMPDGLHPNDAGHIILAEKIENFLKSL